MTRTASNETAASEPSEQQDDAVQLLKAHKAAVGRLVVHALPPFVIIFPSGVRLRMEPGSSYYPGIWVWSSLRML